MFYTGTSRTVQVPFLQQVNDLSEAEKSAAEESMNAARSEASCSEGKLQTVQLQG